jgi:hypothetical protein
MVPLLEESMTPGDTLNKRISNQPEDNISTKDTTLDLLTSRTMGTLLTLMTIWLPTLMSLIGKLETLQVTKLRLNFEKERDTLTSFQKNT